MHVLDIDFDYNLTKEYRLRYENQCDCTYCRNYYETFETKYPDTARFLERFGLSVGFPLEIMPLGYNKPHEEMEYIAYYPIKGTMGVDELILNLEGLEVRVLKDADLNNLCPSPKMKRPYLLIEVSGIKLPWVLDKDV